MEDVRLTEVEALRKALAERNDTIAGLRKELHNTQETSERAVTQWSKEVEAKRRLENDAATHETELAALQQVIDERDAVIVGLKDELKHVAEATDIAEKSVFEVEQQRARVKELEDQLAQARKRVDTMEPMKDELSKMRDTIGRLRETVIRLAMKAEGTL